MTAYYSVDGTEPAPLHGADFAAPESSIVVIRGLAPNDEIVMGETRVYAEKEGAVVIRLAELQAIGLTTATLWRGGRHVARAIIDVTPAKIRQEEFDILWRDLQAVWIPLLYGGRARILAVERQSDLFAVWRETRPLVESICANPHVRLVRGQATAPYTRARNVDFTPSRQLALGVALRTELPTRPIVGSVDTKANRLIVRLCEAVATAAEREGNAVVATDARRLRDHPTLRAISADPFPSLDPSVAKDPRYMKCWKVLRQLAAPASASTTGPFPSPIGLVRLPALYEFWVFLQVTLGVESLLGPPLAPGFEVLGRDRGGNRQELRLQPNTRVDFIGGVSVMFGPVVTAAGRAEDRGEFAFASATHAINRVRPSTRVTPDVVVIGPGGVLVLDAKYSGVEELASISQTLHAKYGGIHAREAPLLRCQEVVAVHPNAAYRYEQFAGHAALPMVPGVPTEWLIGRLQRIVARA